MDPAPCIVVRDLSKRFAFRVREGGRGWLRNLLRPERREITAVDRLNFAVQPGERLAFIGPNGAGKSTVIKMLTGILTPSAGRIHVLGIDPSRDRRRLARQIGTVFGQRSQLLPNLPLTDSLELFGAMYDLGNAELEKRISYLTHRFGLAAFADQPVRKLSLGQRMRAEVAASLLHRPQLVLLDEPTIGLDVVAKKALRDLLLEINREEGTTLFLTSHDVGDIVTLCERTIVVNYGRIVRDLPTAELARSFAREKHIELTAKTRFVRFPDLPDGMQYLRREPERVAVAVAAGPAGVRPAVIRLLALFDADDVSISHTDLEAVIRRLYEDVPVHS